MERAIEERPATPGAPALELLVHGVGGAAPAEVLGDPRTVRVTGDETAAVYRRAVDVNAETAGDAEDAEDTRNTWDAEDAEDAEETWGAAGAAQEAQESQEPLGPRQFRRSRNSREVRKTRPIPEAYVWSHLTSGNGSRALWLLLLPFMVVNLAHWMRPSAADHRARTVRAYGVLVRLTGLTLTVLLTAAACEVALDLVAWQCAGTVACAQDHIWLHFLAPGVFRDGWWTQPGRRLGLAALVPSAVAALLWYLSRRTWSAYESTPPPTQPQHAPPATALGRPGFWYGRRLVARLRAAHTAAALLTVAAAVGTSAARYDRAPAGPATLDALGRALDALLVVGAAVVVWVVVRRGRSEHRADHDLDAALVRWLPLASLVLLASAVVYAGWSRPGWRSGGRLPGDAAFGGITLFQGVLVVALAVTAAVIRHRGPVARTVLGGLGGPATAMLACALGGVMTGGVAQRVGDWLDGAAGAFAGPPTLLTWQASAIPVLLAVLLVLAAVLAVRTAARTRRLLPQVRAEYGVTPAAHDHDAAADDGADGGRTGTGDGGGHGGDGEGAGGSVPEDPARTRSIAATRARATLTDCAPLGIGIASAATLLLGAAALAGTWGTGRVPAEAAKDAPPLVEGAAQACQGLGSWLIGLGFILFVTWGRRAYRDVSARRTIGILWDVGTFWPRAAHPFAPPCYAERAVPDLTWRMATWTRAEPGRRLVLSGHSQGSVLAAAAAWQLGSALRGRVALLTYGSPLERLYGRWFPAHFGPEALGRLHHEVVSWRNLYRLTDPIGGPVRLPGDAELRGGVDAGPLRDPLTYGRSALHPLPAPVLGHGDYQADPAFAAERSRLLAELHPALPAPRGPVHGRGSGDGRGPAAADGEEGQGSSGRSSG